MNRKQLLEEKKRLATLPSFKSRCFICWKKFKKGFSFHHTWYDGNEPDYKSTKYFPYVFNQIRKNPRQFLLLCKAHHYFVEWGKSIKNEAMWLRFCKARKMSQ